MTRSRQTHGPLTRALRGSQKVLQPQHAGVPDPRPARGRGRARPSALGGQKQRALLALLLIHAGETLPSRPDRGQALGRAAAAQRRSTSLQNFVSSLRKVLGVDVLVTKAPGYAAPGRRRASSTSAGSSGSSRRRGGQAPQHGRGCSREALALWRGPPLADSRSRRSRRARSAARGASARRRSRSGSTPSSSSARHAELVGELEALVASTRFASACAAS